MPLDQLTNPEPTSLEARDALWRNLTAAHPSYLDRGADFTPIGLKAFFEVTAQQAFAAGVKRGRADQRSRDELARRRFQNQAAFVKHLEAYFGTPDDAATPPDEGEAGPQRAA